MSQQRQPQMMMDFDEEAAGAAGAVVMEEAATIRPSLSLDVVVEKLGDFELEQDADADDHDQDLQNHNHGGGENGDNGGRGPGTSSFVKVKERLISDATEPTAPLSSSGSHGDSSYATAVGGDSERTAGAGGGDGVLGGSWSLVTGTAASSGAAASGAGTSTPSPAPSPSPGRLGSLASSTGGSFKQRTSEAGSSRRGDRDPRDSVSSQVSDVPELPTRLPPPHRASYSTGFINGAQMHQLQELQQLNNSDGGLQQQTSPSSPSDDDGEVDDAAGAAADNGGKEGGAVAVVAAAAAADDDDDDDDDLGEYGDPVGDAADDDPADDDAESRGDHPNMVAFHRESTSSSGGGAGGSPQQQRHPGAVRRNSFRVTSRQSLAASDVSGASVLSSASFASSAPDIGAGPDPAGGGGGGLGRHRSSMAILASARRGSPAGSTGTSASASRRNSPSLSIRRTSPNVAQSRGGGGGGLADSTSRESGQSGQSSGSKPVLRPLRTFLKSKMISRSDNSRSDGDMCVEDFTANRERALDTLGAGNATEWENMAAAAAVVATGAAASDTRHHRRYGVGDRVLVFQSVVNPSHGRVGGPGVAASVYGSFNSEGVDDDDLDDLRGTANPVNKFGFPPGKGESEEERKGPYVYVLATVKKVHFEEDVWYYTVTREDTKTDQRADTEWMEPVISAKGEAAALKAAHTILKREDVTKQHRQGKTLVESSAESPVWKYCCLCALCLDALWDRMRSCGLCCQKRVLPKMRGWRDAARASVKRQSRLMLNGLRPYECRMRLTMVNVLVGCSLLFMFLDQVRLAFFRSSSDHAVVILELIIWIILVLELMFEVLIRPTGYNALIHSEKAYAPSTARYINRFHLCAEILALGLFVPELSCLFTKRSCGSAIPLTLIYASLKSVLGPGRLEAFAGYCIFAFVRLRIFGLVRHWKQMWIHAALIRQKKEGLCRGFLTPPRGARDAEGWEGQQRVADRAASDKKLTPAADASRDDDSANSDADEESNEKPKKSPSHEEDLRLKNAATIGTALLVINSHRAMLLLVAIVGLLPILNCIRVNGGTNIVTTQMVRLLQANNDAANDSDPVDCDYLQDAVFAWLKATAYEQRTSPVRKDQLDVSLLWAQVLPADQCAFLQNSGGVVTLAFCQGLEEFKSTEICQIWGQSEASSDPAYFADSLGIRVGSIVTRTEGNASNVNDLSVTALFNEEHTVTFANFASFLLQVSLLLLILVGLSVLRVDAGRLVLNPLRRMLKIVLRYAENPLAPAPRRGKDGDAGGDGDYSDSDSDKETDKEDQLGHYETEQLINAVTKITDLLRKCWGVAGAGIISSNLARTEGGQTAVFNPCVPGRLVYALFAFVGINDFSHHLRSLDQDVMILINDVARVVHGEVYRWGFGDTGQCNKNLGSTFLMVFRIGDSKEVQEKKNRATEVVFSSTQKGKRLLPSRRRQKLSKQGGLLHSGQSKAIIKRKKFAVRRRKMSDLMSETSSLQLVSLPGISNFTDRAVIGMLKTFAGVYRDKNIQNWKDDFRLGAGVGAFSVDMIFGMDAGWAVEGAVGSEYKIDATYLSPHVNMAARMMSASKQYGVNLLVSQAVEELLSDTARSKLRHIDTVTVKGSSLRQRIFTYDMRHKGVDFFLFARSDKDADLDAECYSPSIWNTDQDLKAMRQHISQEFLVEFQFGRDQYLAGNWGVAITHLKRADDMMIRTVVDEGYIEEYIEDITDGLEEKLLDREDNSNPEVTRLRNEIGDGPSRSLIAYMENRGCVAPAGWEGYRPLTSK